MSVDWFFEHALLLPRRARAVINARVENLGLTNATSRTLYFLGRLGDGVRVKDLAEALELERPSLAALLDRLEEGGFVQRREDTADRRGKTLHLTARGRAIFHQADDLVREVRQEILAGVAPEDFAACRRVFDRAFANLEKLRAGEGA
ncbi:hypothetical protein CCR94_05110 [Rhodoblastus sphagnicola]|uniref:Uncharacterized protein n=1 Tax=Rhodoblastus sphagnicola TaxID=333368 RepID=A0A2S6ND93_9HYPH|nr:MarR family transcriptional regulator [Rhodoblastus sphagnicola]MBB4198003.1 MarR family transcriptional regulator for hemolysin [Rhodoblastus sphagnicola]PPQ32561.1 hypothetical protein CCR94_05110 [Rhodoblastus sphagnicola]